MAHVRSNPFRRAATFLVLASLLGLLIACTQLAFAGEALPRLPLSFREMTVKNATASCLEPPPLPGIQEYDGPLKKTVGMLATTLERPAVHQPRYKPGLALCTLDVRGKFLLFSDYLLDPVTYLSAGFDATSDQLGNRDPQFGHGLAGYGRRFGVDLTDRISSRFFKGFAYPALLSEDPRYYRLGHGSGWTRVVHAASHLVVAHHGDGTRMFNYSEWLGTTTSTLLSNSYHPGNERGFGPVAGTVAFGFATDVGFDILREFWPEISVKFKLPFTR